MVVVLSELATGTVLVKRNMLLQDFDAFREWRWATIKCALMYFSIEALSGFQLGTNTRLLAIQDVRSAIRFVSHDPLVRLLLKRFGGILPNTFPDNLLVLKRKKENILAFNWNGRIPTHLSTDIADPSQINLNRIHLQPSFQSF